MKTHPPASDDATATELALCATPEAAFDRLVKLYDEAIAEIEKAFGAFSRGENGPPGSPPVYPYLCVDVAFGEMRSTGLAFGKVTSPGRYGTTITAPHLFRAYLIEQLTLLMRKYEVKIYVGKSRTPIPLTFAVERAVLHMDDE